MRKGFINILINIIVAIAITVGGIFYSISNTKPQPLKFIDDDKLGASITAKFPSSLNNFAEGDIIEEEDWNAIEQIIGTTSTATTTALFYKLTHSSSSDPGHKHTTSAVSGTIAIAQGGTGSSTAAGARTNLGLGTIATENTPLAVNKGGTATTTYTYGVVIASSTNDFTTIAPGSIGNTLKSNGTAWVSSSSAVTFTDKTSIIAVTNINGTYDDTTVITTSNLTESKVGLISFIGSIEANGNYETAFLSFNINASTTILATTNNGIFISGATGNIRVPMGGSILHTFGVGTSTVRTRIVESGASDVDLEGILSVIIF